MAKVSLLKKVWENRNLRNTVILIFLVITLIVVLIINLRPPEPRKSERVLICDQCNYTDLFYFVAIEDLRCPKCSDGKMRYGMKCRKCEYEFPYINTPLTKKQMKSMNSIRAKRVLDRRCPNCGDVEVFPISMYLWKKKHGIK